MHKLLILVILPVASALAYFVIWPGESIGQVIFLAIKLLIPLLVVLFVGHKRILILIKEFNIVSALKGLALGLVMAMVIFLSYFFLSKKLLDFEHIIVFFEKSKLNLSGYILICIYWAMVNAFVEEVMYRYYWQKYFNNLLIGVVLSSVIFVVHHAIVMSGYFNILTNIVCCCGIFVAGIIWGLIYLKNKDFTICYISHIIADVAIFYCGYLLLF